MTTTEWIINIALVLVVLRQLQEHRIDRRFVLIPLALVAYSAHAYLHSIPTRGHDLYLMAGFVLLGLAFGLLGGLATSVRTDGRHAYARATTTAAALWVTGMSGRIAFVLWTEHGGADAVARFSQHNQITGYNAWVAGLILMVLVEVGSRISLIVLRGYRQTSAARAGGATLGRFAIAA